jgi:hypothetical protein
MGNNGSPFIAGLGLGILGMLTALGIYEAATLAAAGKEVPGWLSQVIGGLSGNLGLIVVLVFRGTGSNGNGTKP